MQAKAEFQKLTVFVQLDTGLNPTEATDLTKKVKLANSFRQLK